MNFWPQRSFKSKLEPLYNSFSIKKINSLKWTHIVHNDGAMLAFQLIYGKAILIETQRPMGKPTSIEHKLGATPACLWRSDRV